MPRATKSSPAASKRAGAAKATSAATAPKTAKAGKTTKTTKTPKTTKTTKTTKGAAPATGTASPAPTRVPLGRAIAVRRAELALKRTELARRAGLSSPYLSEIERERKTPSAAALAALAGALELTSAELLARAEQLDRPATRDADLAGLVRDLVRQELDRVHPGSTTAATTTTHADGERAPSTTGSTTGSTAGATSVRDAVLAAAREMLDNESIDFDVEGDIPIRRNDVMLFLRVLDDPMSVLVFSPMLVGIDESAALLERVNELNANVHFVRFCVTHGGVVADIELFGDPFEPALVGAACRSLTQTVEVVGPEMQAEYGGRLFFGDEHEPKPRPGTGGYL